MKKLIQKISKAFLNLFSNTYNQDIIFSMPTSTASYRPWPLHTVACPSNITLISTTGSSPEMTSMTVQLFAHFPNTCSRSLDNFSWRKIRGLTIQDQGLKTKLTLLLRSFHLLDVSKRKKD